MSKVVLGMDVASSEFHKHRNMIWISKLELYRPRSLFFQGKCLAPSANFYARIIPFKILKTLLIRTTGRTELPSRKRWGRGCR
jgi:hypothetical protein